MRAATPVPLTSRTQATTSPGGARSALIALGGSPALCGGAALIALVAAIGIVAPLLTAYSPDQIIPGARLRPPGAGHLFGTDALGRDLLTRVAFGAHLAARMALLGVALSASVGLILGVCAGFYVSWLDQVASRAIDGWLALPGALVAIVIVARLGASLDSLTLALGMMGVPSFFRVARNTTLGIRRLAFIEAATALGASDLRLMWRHIVPNIASPIVVLVTLRLGTTVLMGSSLSFIGLGAQPPAPEWGALLAAGRSHVESAWWLAVFPGAAVTLTVVGLNLLGDGLRDVLDPRHQLRRGDDQLSETCAPVTPTRNHP